MQACPSAALVSPDTAIMHLSGHLRCQSPNRGVSMHRRSVAVGVEPCSITPGAAVCRAGVHGLVRLCSRSYGHALSKQTNSESPVSCSMAEQAVNAAKKTLLTCSWLKMVADQRQSYRDSVEAECKQLLELTRRADSPCSNSRCPACQRCQGLQIPERGCTILQTLARALRCPGSA